MMMSKNQKRLLDIQADLLLRDVQEEEDRLLQAVDDSDLDGDDASVVIDDVSNDDDVSDDDDVNDDVNDDDDDDDDEDYNGDSKTEMDNLKYALHKILITHLSEEIKGGVQIRMGKYHDLLFSNLNQEMQDVATRWSGLLTDTVFSTGNSIAKSWQSRMFHEVRYMLGIGRETSQRNHIYRLASESRTTPTLLPTREQQFLIIEDLTKLRDDNNDPSFLYRKRQQCSFPTKT
jgi:hypothetical protein